MGGTVSFGFARVCVVGSLLTLAIVGSAAAQAPPAGQPASTTPPPGAAKLSGGDIEAGLALFNHVTNKGQDATYGPGWYVGGSYQITPVISLVGLLTADYDKADGRTASIYSYSGGPRFQWRRTERLRPFFQVLFGGGQDNGVFVASSTTNYYPMLAPGAGVDLAVAERFIVRARFDVPLFMRFSDTFVGTRLSVGLSVPLGSR